MGNRFVLVRVSAAASLVAACILVVALAVALSRTPAFTPSDFLSGLGADGAPAVVTYRLALIAAALSAALFGFSLHRAYPQVAAIGYLSAAAVLLGSSAALPCDAGCPIPIVESGGGLVNALHFFITAGAFILLVFAMLLVSRRCPDPVLRWTSLAAMVGVGGLMAVLAVLLLFATHSLMSATVERVLLAGAFGWLVFCAARLTARPVVPPVTSAGVPP